MCLITGHCPKPHWGTPLYMIKALYSLSKILTSKTHLSLKVSNKGLETCLLIPVAWEKWRDWLGLFIPPKALLSALLYTTLEVLTENPMFPKLPAPACLFLSCSPVQSPLRYVADDLCPEKPQNVPHWRQPHEQAMARTAQPLGSSTPSRTQLSFVFLQQLSVSASTSQRERVSHVMSD